jgi:hypothetical protein
LRLIAFKTLNVEIEERVGQLVQSHSILSSGNELSKCMPKGNFVCSGVPSVKNDGSPSH